MSDRRWLAPALLGLFVLSGFAGLIYQSIWSHYLGLTLGHAAYAQTLVLAMFMGGMALGAWLVSRHGERLKRLIFGYAVVEAVIGLMGLLFHPFFLFYTDFSQDTVLPAVGGLGLSWLWQWGSAAALIAPQTILLGATFPLMSAGLLRARTAGDAEVLGGLYFTNSLGAAIGVLAATFLLLPSVGMPGAMMIAGALNLLVAALAWGVSRAMREEQQPVLAVSAEVQAGGEQATEVQQLYRVLLASTFLSSAASFCYEIGWVRLLNQALGTTLHSFELMLATFIAGMAFGGLWIRNRAAKVKDVVQYAGYVQVFMGAAALISVPMLSSSFDWVSWMMGALSRTGEAYTLYALGTAAISMLIMFPAAFFAGMTLPLFTTALLRRGAGEAAIGRVYAANTVGAIVGVVFAVHVLIPLMGIRLTVTLAALADALIGLYLLRMVSPGRMSLPVAMAGLGAAALLAFSLSQGRFDPLQQVAGVFRTGVARSDAQTTVHYLKDGSTATISVFDTPSSSVISTNGKPDASLTPMGNLPTTDEITMLMAAALPLSTHPKPERVAIIGWGSGLTTHTMLGSAAPSVVDNIEIERAMWEGAKLFGPRVARAYSDPRSKVYFDDARTFFAAGSRRYDVIISEPSNPWVSGVASLFTEEFYRFLHRHLEDDGQLVQWIQTYEIDNGMVATMLAALLEVFPNSTVYLTNSADLLILARKDAGATEYSDLPWQEAALAQELSRVGLASVADLQVRRLGGPAVLRSFVKLHQATPHSDFYPTVSLRGPMTRFMRAEATMLARHALVGLPGLEVLECFDRTQLSGRVTQARASSVVQNFLLADQLADALLAPESSREIWLTEPGLAARIAHLANPPGPVVELDRSDTSERLAVTAAMTLHTVGAEKRVRLWAEPSWVHPERLDSEALRQQWSLLSAAARRDWVSVKAGAQALLGSDLLDELHPIAREQVLALGSLASIATGDAAQARVLEETYGAKVVSASIDDVRALMLSWGETEPVCSAAQASR